MEGYVSLLLGRYVLYRVVCHVLHGIMLFIYWGFCH